MAKTPKLTQQEAQQAIVIDFEGNMDRAPSLLGWRIGATNHQVLLEKALAPVVPPDSIEVLELDDALRRIKAAAGGNHVLGYSEHDLSVIRTYSSETELIAWFEDRYLNAKSLIDRWINRRAHAGEIQRPDDLTLQSSMSLIGITYAVAAGPDTVGTTLRRLRDFASKGRTHTDLPPGIRRRWHRLLSHNATDLRATQALVLESVGGNEQR